MGSPEECKSRVASMIRSTTAGSEEGERVLTPPAPSTASERAKQFASFANRTGRSRSVTFARIATSAEIRKEMSAFSEEALKIPAVPPPAAIPPTAGDDLKKTESEATFPESLSRKDPSPEPMGKKKETARVYAPSGEAKFMLQAGAMKSRETAEGLRNRLDRRGYKAKVIHAKTRTLGEVYRVRVGPFGSRGEAMKAMKAIRAEMKIDVILLKG